MAVVVIQEVAYENGKFDPPVNLLCVNADVVAGLPLTYPQGSKAWTTDTKVLYIFDGLAWSIV